MTVDGSEQSHVDVGDPGDLALEYVRRIGYALDAMAPPGAPLRILHLGGGGLTLVRYAATTRPGSEQYVVESEAGLLDFALEHAPLPVGTSLHIRHGDARGPLPDGAPFDVIVVDVYVGTDVPASLLEDGFIALLADRVAPAGLVLVNVADEAGLPLARAWRAGFARRFPHTSLVAAADVIAGRSAGNAVLLASGGDGFDEWVAALLRHGPHPAAADADSDVVIVQVAVEVDP